MANKHFLSLYVIETSNCSVLNVIDTSIYTDDIPMDCGELLITPIPGYATHGETAWLSPLTDWSKI